MGSYPCTSEKVVLAFGSTERASAMERMIARLREVTSFQYSLHDMNKFTWEGTEELVIVEHLGTVWWQAPHSLHETGLIIKYPANRPPLERQYQLRSRFEATHPADKSGIVIDHLREAVRWVPEFRGDFGKDGPTAMLRMVRNRDGEMVRELGTKMIDGKQAHGFVMRLDDAEEGSGLDALAVWVDPDTDLPLEFEFEYEYEAEWGAYSFRLYDCRWNLQLAPQLFVAEAPEEYTDTTPPKSQAAIDQITAALGLYAKLSGGHYPRIEYFYGDAVHKEMLQMAGFSGEPQTDWAENEQYRQVQQTIEGLDWLTRILRSPPHTGYFGETIGIDDRDKVLLWWVNVDQKQSYRVFYGNLETEVVEDDWGVRLREGESPRDRSR